MTSCPSISGDIIFSVVMEGEKGNWELSSARVVTGRGPRPWCIQHIIIPLLPTRIPPFLSRRRINNLLFPLPVLFFSCQRDSRSKSLMKCSCCCCCFIGCAAFSLNWARKGKTLLNSIFYMKLFLFFLFPGGQRPPAFPGFAGTPGM